MPATRYKIWGWGPPVGEGVTGSCHVGVAGIAKAASARYPLTVATEFICGELGRAVRLPVPPGFIVDRDNVPYYVSLDFNLAGEGLPPADAAHLAEKKADFWAGILLERRQQMGNLIAKAKVEFPKIETSQWAELNWSPS